MTTRQKWLRQSFQRLELEVLDKDAALELLISFVGDGRIGGELEEAEALCNDLGFLPLGQHSRLPKDAISTKIRSIHNDSKKSYP